MDYLVKRDEALEIELANTFWTKRSIRLQLYAASRPITQICPACHLEYNVPAIYAGTRAFAECDDLFCIEARLKGINLAERKVQ